MSIVTNIISKLLKEDENEACILTFCDFEQELSEEYLLNYINEIIKNNPILKQTIIALHLKLKDIFILEKRTQP